MEKRINLKKSVYELCSEYPELIQIMEDLGFNDVTNKAKLNTIGRVMTIPKGAIVKGIDMIDVVLALKNNGFVLEGKMPDFVSKKLDKNLEEKSSHAQDNNTDERTELLKNYIKRLSSGEDLESVKKDFVENFSEVEAGEIAKAEQSLIAGGMPVSEVQKLCDVHSALFHGATKAEKIANAEKAVEKSLNDKNYGMGIGSKRKAKPVKRQDGADEKYLELKEIPNHPLNIFALENEAISNALQNLRKSMENKSEVLNALDKARELSIHYAEKGDLLYPLLKQKYGFAGPSDVMWSVDDDIRDEMKNLSGSAKEFSSLLEDTEWNNRLNDVVTRAEEMIYKEESILFPLCAKNFSTKEWQDIARDFDDYKPCLIQKRPLWEKATPKTHIENLTQTLGCINFPSGHLSAYQLDAMLNTIPIEISFVDENNINCYFNEQKEPKLFKRPIMALDREVFSCHPPKIEPLVRTIIEDFRNGTRSCVDVWANRDNQPVLIKYMAVRDAKNNYVGTLECVQPMGFAQEHFEKLSKEK
ncbi:DUF438 domain-containing protein [Butyrivibrio sp. NC3005]|uniref:DUF438 domain-containing protein n=1 Tax=Butyrivibrio sp. NC3005 TaxID=1280685 RepID=UPI00042347CA|nr:DUF438 domain-containing protein [Butyrivibrio sp. NC3005]